MLRAHMQKIFSAMTGQQSRPVLRSHDSKVCVQVKNAKLSSLKTEMSGTTQMFVLKHVKIKKGRERVRQ